MNRAEDPRGSCEQEKPEQKAAGYRKTKEESVAVPQRSLDPTWAKSQRRMEDEDAGRGVRLLHAGGKEDPPRTIMAVLPKG